MSDNKNNSNNRLNNSKPEVVVPNVANSRRVSIIPRNNDTTLQEQPAQQMHTIQEPSVTETAGNGTEVGNGIKHQIHQPTTNRNKNHFLRRIKSSLENKDVGNRNLRNRVVTRFNNNENQNREKNNIQSNTGTAQNTENIKIIREPNRERIAPRRRPNSVLTTNKEKERYRIIRESIEATIKTFPEDMKETDIIHLWF